MQPESDAYDSDGLVGYKWKQNAQKTRSADVSVPSEFLEAMLKTGDKNACWTDWHTQYVGAINLLYCASILLRESVGIVQPEHSPGSFFAENGQKS